MISRNPRHVWAACAGLACLALVRPAQAQLASAPLEARVDGGVVRGTLEHDFIRPRPTPRSNGWTWPSAWHSGKDTDRPPNAAGTRSSRRTSRRAGPGETRTARGRH